MYARAEMTDPGSGLPSVDTFFHWLVGLIMAVFGWLGKKYADKVERLEETTVKQEDFKDVLKELRGDLRQAHKDNLGHLDRIERRIDRLSPGRLHDDEVG